MAKEDLGSVLASRPWLDEEQNCERNQQSKSGQSLSLVLSQTAFSLPPGHS
jgi:hypothetical protein